jgi:hypothetical protein
MDSTGNCRAASLESLRQVDMLKWLHSNQSPSQAEQSHINRLAQQAQKETSVTREHIRQLQSQAEQSHIHCLAHQARKEASVMRGHIRQLQNDERELQHCIEQCQSLLSPIRRLPNEILSEVFGRCATPNIISTAPVFKNTVHGLRIASVCSYWRTIALLTPRLWSKLGLVCYTQEGEGNTSFHSEHDIKLLEFLFCKSQQRPLDVVLSIKGPGSEFSLVLKLLLAEAHRWRTLKIITTDVMAQKILSQVASFPMLEHLAMHLDREGSQGGANVTRFVAPKLKSVRKMGNLSSMELFPANEITEEIECMKIDTSSWSSILDCISRAFTLRRLDICEPLKDMREKIASYEHVTDLVIGGNTYLWVPNPETIFKEVFEALKLPNLTSLTLKKSSSSDYWPLASFKLFVNDCRLKVTNFTVEGISFPEDTLLSALDLLPNLQYFRLVERNRPEPSGASPNLAKELFDRLTGSPGFLSQLHTLELAVSCTNLTDEAIIEMFATRSSDRLRRFELTMLDRSFAVEDMKMLKDIRKNGHAQVKGKGGRFICSCKDY